MLSWSQDRKFCSVWAWNFFGWKVWKAPTEFRRSSRNHLETSTQSDYKRKNNEFESKRLSQELEWKKWKRSKGFWGEKSKGNSPVIVYVTESTVSLSAPVAQTFDSAIHWINDFSERERESITRACRPILDPTAPSFLLVQIKPNGSGRRLGQTHSRATRHNF